MARSGFHDNTDVASESGEAIQYTALRDPTKVSPQERGHLRLGQTQQMSRLRLSQALTLDEFGDLGHELGLDKHGLRIRHADISVDVSAARLDLDRMHGFTFPHGAYSFAADSAAFNLYPNRYNRQGHAWLSSLGHSRRRKG